MLTPLEQVLANIPSFSPNTGKHLITVMEAITRRIEAGGLPEKVVTDLKTYYEGLETVVTYGLIQQRAVIQQLATLVKGKDDVL